MNNLLVNSLIIVFFNKTNANKQLLIINKFYTSILKT